VNTIGALPGAALVLSDFLLPLLPAGPSLAMAFSGSKESSGLLAVCELAFVSIRCVSSGWAYTDSGPGFEGLDQWRSFSFWHEGWRESSLSLAAMALTCLLWVLVVAELESAPPPDLMQGTKPWTGAPWLSSPWPVGQLLSLETLFRSARGPRPVAKPCRINSSVRAVSTSGGGGLTILAIPRQALTLVAAANYQPAGAGGGHRFRLASASPGQQRHRARNAVSRRSARP